MKKKKKKKKKMRRRKSSADSLHAYPCIVGHVQVLIVWHQLHDRTAVGRAMLVTWNVCKSPNAIEFEIGLGFGWVYVGIGFEFTQPLFC